MNGSSTISLCRTPNQHARPAALDVNGPAVVFRGYQEFELTRETITPLPGDVALRTKQALLAEIVVPRHFGGRTVLDLGANAGFFSFWSLQHGAGSATAIDIDPQYVAMVAAASARHGLPVTAHECNVADWTEPAGCVFALAIVHWLYSCTATTGSLQSLAARLAELTQHLLIVEFVDPMDPAVLDFKHLDWNPGVAREPYTRAAFEQALAPHFARVVRAGDVTATRSLYVAFKTRHDIDLQCPLPLLHDQSSVVSCRRLATHDGKDYWSRVYDLGGVIRKQTTGDLAAREASLLRRVRSDYFPRVLGSFERDTYSVADLEHVNGPMLADVAAALAADADRLRAFAGHFPPLLAQLAEAGIAHRDIHAENILVRDGRPVLVDFGWAVAPDKPLFVPAGLVSTGEPGGGGKDAAVASHCDARAVGRLLETVAADLLPELRPAMALFEHPDPGLRVADPQARRELLAAVIGRNTAVLNLLTQVDARERALAQWPERRAQEVEAAVARHLDVLASAAPAQPLSSPQFAALVDYARRLRAAGAAGEARDVVVSGRLRLAPDAAADCWFTLTYMLGSLCRELGRVDDALACFTQILSRAAEPAAQAFAAGALFHSGLVHESLGQPQRAAACFARCLALSPDHGGGLAGRERLAPLVGTTARPGVIWGTGAAGLAARATLPPIDAFVDSDASRWGSSDAGAPIRSPLELRTMNPRPFVYICSMHHTQIAASLDDMGFVPVLDYQVGAGGGAAVVSRSEVFGRIYQENAWGSGESRSGNGSTLGATRDLRAGIRALVEELSIRTAVDAPCGDMAWMHTLTDAFDDYLGLDIVPDLVARNAAAHAADGVRFVCADLVRDPLPLADLVICRDCLVHLPLADGMRALRNIVASGARYLLTTTFTGPRDGMDIPTGAWRPLNLERAPFLLPPPLRILNEGCREGGGDFADKSLGLWDLHAPAVRDAILRTRPERAA